jgi:hypothetical protein
VKLKASPAAWPRSIPARQAIPAPRRRRITSDDRQPRERADSGRRSEHPDRSGQSERANPARSPAPGASRRPESPSRPSRPTNRTVAFQPRARRCRNSFGPDPGTRLAGERHAPTHSKPLLQKRHSHRHGNESVQAAIGYARYPALRL